MLSNRMNPVLLVGLLAASLLVTSCSLMGPTKEEVAAEQEKAKQFEANEKAKKVAAEKKIKAAAEKKAAEQEDTIQMKEVKVVISPVSEKISDIQTAAVSHVAMLDIPTAPDTYLVTREKKDKTHPFFAVGDNRGFLINGEQGKYVIARRNHPVTFQVRTGPMHDFYISTSPKGWGAATYRAGVSGQFTYNGNVTLTPNLNTPDALYYACRNHNSMGGKIVIVDESVDILALEQTLAAEHRALLAKHKNIATKAVDPKKVKQKIAYAGMLLQFKGGGLTAPQRGLIEEKLNSAKSLQAQGNLEEALAVAQVAVELFNKKEGDVVLSAEELAEQKETFNDVLITLEAFIDAHLASYKQAKEEGRKTIAYDSDAVGSFVVDAKKLADKQQYESAGKQLKKAERMVTGALNEMLNSQTIVYDLNFKTPADEFEYEVNRYKGYVELIPVAIEVKKPSAGSIKYAKTFEEKAEFFKAKAREAAGAGRWEEALVVIKDATMEVRRGLRILGVNM